MCNPSGDRINPRYSTILVWKVHFNMVEYLGFILSPEGLHMDPVKVSMIQDIPPYWCGRCTSWGWHRGLHLGVIVKPPGHGPYAHLGNRSRLGYCLCNLSHQYGGIS